MSGYNQRRNIYREERRIMKNDDYFNKKIMSHASYTNLFLTNDKINEVMDNMDIDEQAKRDFLRYMIEESFPGDIVDFLTFNYLFDPILDLYHELFIARYGTNHLKKKLPNFMYVYDIITDCSPYHKNNFCVTHGDSAYLISEKVNGIQFFKLLEQETLTAEDFFSIFIQIINALYVAKEECNFVHGDLHPRNIMIETLDKEIHIPLYLESDNPTKYITTKRVARIIDFEFSNISFEGKNYNAEDDVFGNTRIISCVGDLFKLTMDLYLYSSHNNIGEVVDIIIDAFDNTTKTPFTIAEYTNKHMDQTIPGFVVDVDHYLDHIRLSNEILKENINFSYRDYYHYICDHYTGVIQEVIINEPKNAFVPFIYNHKKLYNKAGELSKVYSGNTITSNWQIKFITLKRIKTKEILQKAMKVVYNSLDVKLMKKELENAALNTTRLTNTKRYFFGKPNKTNYESFIDLIKEYNVIKTKYITSYMNLLYIIGIIKKLEIAKYDVSKYQKLREAMYRFIETQDTSHILSHLENIDGHIKKIANPPKAYRKEVSLTLEDSNSLSEVMGAIFRKKFLNSKTFSR